MSTRRHCGEKLAKKWQGKKDFFFFFLNIVLSCTAGLVLWVVEHSWMQSQKINVSGCLLNFADVSRHVEGFQQDYEFTVFKFQVSVLAVFLHWGIDIGIK